MSAVDPGPYPCGWYGVAGYLPEATASHAI